MLKEIEWYDSRVAVPSCNSYEHYLVVRNINNEPYEAHRGEKQYNSGKVGVCAWVPTDNYKSGYWAQMGHGATYWLESYKLKVDDVLYWAYLPGCPEINNKETQC